MFGSGSTLFIAKMADLHGQQNTCEPQVCFGFKALTRWWRHLTDTGFFKERVYPGVRGDFVNIICGYTVL